MFGNTFNPYLTNPYAVQYQNQIHQTQQNQNLVSQNNGIIWVQGTPGAKSYIVAPGNTVQLMDSEQNLFYLKSCDAQGMPSLRTFEYKEIFANTPTTHENAPNSAVHFDPTNYITRDEFKAEMEKIASKTSVNEEVDS